MMKGGDDVDIQNVLDEIEAHPWVSVSELSEKLQIPAGELNRLCKKLAKRGVIEKRRTSNDKGHRVIVRIPERG